VVQQGLNGQTRYARRYHWLSEALPGFVSEPHVAVACDRRGPALNLVAGEGTILLDEVDALGLEQQAKLLRVIETGQYEPVGSNDT
jgi:hypothetical protein